MYFTHYAAESQKKIFLITYCPANKLQPIPDSDVIFAAMQFASPQKQINQLSDTVIVPSAYVRGFNSPKDVTTSVLTV